MELITHTSATPGLIPWLPFSLTPSIIWLARGTKRHAGPNVAIINGPGGLLTAQLCVVDSLGGTIESVTVQT